MQERAAFKAILLESLSSRRGEHTVSGIVPIPEMVSLADATRRYIASVKDRYGVLVDTNASSPKFPNSRGDIDYEFDSRPRRFAIGGTLDEGTALKILFFTAHGVGHVWQSSDKERWRISEELIGPASAHTGSYQMNDQVRVGKEIGLFTDIFMKNESDATRYGWQTIEDTLKGSYDDRALEELRFWYSLYGITDHLYHRQSIHGPFPSEPMGWVKAFGEKFEAVLMPYMLRARTEPSEGRLNFDCAYGASDGNFYWAGQTMLKGLDMMRTEFFKGTLDPFPPLQRDIDDGGELKPPDCRSAERQNRTRYSTKSQPTP